MERILKRLHGIKADKYLHFICGMVAAQIAFALFALGFAGWISAGLSLCTSVFIGGAKELIDRAGDGVASWKDFWATVAGSVLGVLIMLVP